MGNGASRTSTASGSSRLSRKSRMTKSIRVAPISQPPPAKGSRPSFESHDPPAKRPTAQRIREEHEAYVRNKVDRAIGKIQAEKAVLNQDWRETADTGSLPPALTAVVTAETLDAIGTMYCTVQYLKAQKNETKGKLIKSIIGKNRTSNVHDNLDKQNQHIEYEEEKLNKATAAAARWGLELQCFADKIPEAVTDVEARCKSLPLASTDPSLPNLEPCDLTVQRVMGFYVLKDKKKHAAAALAEYNRRRGEATGGIVEKILKDVASYDEVYGDILSDPSAGSALDELNRLSNLAPQPFGTDHKPLDMAGFDQLVSATSGADTPRTTRVEYAIYSRNLAADGSIVLYDTVANVVVSAATTLHAPIDAAYVVPGGVKKLARYVFKTVTKYSCDFLLCKDIMRCTVVTTSLAAVAEVVKALFASKDIVVVRTKNRFARGFDAKPGGGYRDYQLLVVFNNGGDRWLFGEIQVNLEQMVNIKSRPQGGHALYKFARSLAAFDEKVYTHSGGWSKRAAEQMAAGVLMTVDMSGALVNLGNMMTNMAKVVGQLSSSLRSSKCRVQHLNLQYNDLKSNAVDIADALKRNSSVVSIRMGGNGLGPEGGVAFAEALKVNSNITSVDLSQNNLGDEGGKAIAEALASNKAVKELRLSSNNFAKSTEAMIIEAWGNRKGTLELSGKVEGHSFNPLKAKENLGKAKKFCLNIIS